MRQVSADAGRYAGRLLGRLGRVVFVRFLALLAVMILATPAFEACASPAHHHSVAIHVAVDATAGDAERCVAHHCVHCGCHQAMPAALTTALPVRDRLPLRWQAVAERPEPRALAPPHEPPRI